MQNKSVRDLSCRPIINLAVFIFFLTLSTVIANLEAVSYGDSRSAHENHGKPIILALTQSNKPLAAIDLKTALKLALKNYPGILSSKYNYTASVFTKEESLYNYYPQISAGLQFSKGYAMTVSSEANINPPSFVDNGGINYTLNNYQGDLNASYLIYSFGSRHYNFMQSFYNMKGAKSVYSQTVNTALYNVILYFAQYFQDKELEKADKENLKNSEIEYKASEAFYKVGTGDLLDAKTAKAAMETAKAAYITSEFNLKIAKLSLLNSIGLSLNKRYRFVNTLKIRRLSEKLKGLTVLALKYNPGLTQQEYLVKSAKAAIGEAKTGYYPSLNANFIYTGQNGAFPLNRNYSVGLAVNIPIFNGFLTQNKVQFSKASLNSTLWSKALTKANIIFSISQDYYAIKSQYLTLAALRESEIASLLAYKLALKSYEVGVGSMVQLVTANALYISAETSYINAKFTYSYRKAQLYSDLGLMTEHYINK